MMDDGAVQFSVCLPIVALVLNIHTLYNMLYNNILQASYCSVVTTVRTDDHYSFYTHFRQCRPTHLKPKTSTTPPKQATLSGSSGIIRRLLMRYFTTINT